MTEPSSSSSPCSVCGLEFDPNTITIHQRKCLQKLKDDLSNEKKCPRSSSSCNSNITLPKLPRNCTRNQPQERPKTAKLKSPRVLNLAYIDYDMSQTRLNFASSSSTFLPDVGDKKHTTSCPRVNSVNQLHNTLPFVTSENEISEFNEPISKSSNSPSTLSHVFIAKSELGSESIKLSPKSQSFHEQEECCREEASTCDGCQNSCLPKMNILQSFCCRVEIESQQSTKRPTSSIISQFSSSSCCCLSMLQNKVAPDNPPHILITSHPVKLEPESVILETNSCPSPHPHKSNNEAKIAIPVIKIEPTSDQWEKVNVIEEKNYTVQCQSQIEQLTKNMENDKKFNSCNKNAKSGTKLPCVPESNNFIESEKESDIAGSSIEEEHPNMLITTLANEQEPVGDAAAIDRNDDTNARLESYFTEMVLKQEIAELSRKRTTTTKLMEKSKSPEVKNQIAKLEASVEDQFELSSSPETVFERADYNNELPFSSLKLDKSTTRKDACMQNKVEFTNSIVHSLNRLHTRHTKEFAVDNNSTTFQKGVNFKPQHGEKPPPSNSLGSAVDNLPKIQQNSPWQPSQLKLSRPVTAFKSHRTLSVQQYGLLPKCDEAKVKVQRSGCKSACVAGTQTPSPGQRLLTPTQVRRQLKSASANQKINTKSTNLSNTGSETNVSPSFRPRTQETFPATMTNSIPLVPKSQENIQTQTFSKERVNSSRRPMKVLYEKTKEIAIPTTTDESENSASIPIHKTPKANSQVKLKKVRVSSSKESDQIRLSYRVKSSHAPHPASAKESLKSTLFSNIVFIPPVHETCPLLNKMDFIDFNIVVRRKNADGSFPKLENIVTEINPDNFYLIMDLNAIGETVPLSNYSGNVEAVPETDDTHPDSSLPPQINTEVKQDLFEDTRQKFKRNYRVNQYNSFIPF